MKNSPKKITLESVDSTSAYLNRNPDIDICIADEQTAGKGTQNRDWHSPAGLNIYMSLRQIHNRTPQQLSCLSTIIGLAVIHTLESLAIPGLKIKWTNDIYHNEKKMAGILVNLRAIDKTTTEAIVGLGMNVNAKEKDLRDLNNPWTSLALIVDKKFDRDVLIEKLIETINFYCQTYQSIDETLMSQWKEHDLLYNRNITVTNGNVVLSGKAKGITSQSELLVEDDYRKLHAVRCGRISW